MKKLLILPLLLSFCFVSGCGLFTVEIKVPTDKPAIKASANPLEDEIVAALKDAPKEDCIVIYKIFRGAAEYFTHSKKLGNTIDCFDVLGKVEDDFGWEKEKYSKLTDIIEADLKSKEFLNPTKFDEDVRTKIVKTFQEYSDIIRKVIESKKQ